MSLCCVHLQDKYINVQALAIQHCPDLFPRGKGKLHWQSEAATGYSNPGNIGGLRQYISDNRESLQCEVQRRRDRAAASSRQLAEVPKFPIRNRDWLHWLEQNEVEHRAKLTRHNVLICSPYMIDIILLCCRYIAFCFDVDT